MSNPIGLSEWLRRVARETDVKRRTVTILSGGISIQGVIVSAQTDHVVVIHDRIAEYRLPYRNIQHVRRCL